MLSLPEAMDPLIDYYKRFLDENPDWDDYRARMERERRVLIQIELDLRGSGPSGLNFREPARQPQDQLEPCLGPLRLSR